MKHIKVTVEGYGTYQINIEKAGELVSWLSRNQAVSTPENNTIREITNNQFTGRTLLQEDVQ